MAIGFAIVEEDWQTGRLCYVRLERALSRNGSWTLRRVGFHATHIAPLPTDMIYGDRDEAEDDAALLRLLARGGSPCGFWAIALDKAAVDAIRGLATARAAS